MDSWWKLGEHSGFQGNELSLYKIECAFCGEKGNFALEHHAEKRKASSSKTLNFDTYKCGNCGGYVMVLWSASEFGGRRGLHSYSVLPYPLGKWEGSDNWSSTVERYWKQAHDNLGNENYEAAVLMARSALQAVTRSQGAKGDNLYEEIEDLAGAGVLPEVIKTWSHEVRLLARPAAHPGVDEPETDSRDAKDIVTFLDFLLEYIYDLPARISEYRKRRTEV